MVLGIFGQSKNERITREAYVLLWNAAERLKHARALRENLEPVAKRAPWIERNELGRTADCLAKYGAALACMAVGLLGQLPEFKERPFLNVAVQPDKERAILELFYSTEAHQIRQEVHDFDERDDGVPSVSDIVQDILSGRQ